MSKPTNEIIDKYLAPIFETLSKAEVILAAEEDVSTDAKKQSLLNWLKTIINEFEEMKDGVFELVNPDLISEAELTRLDKGINSLTVDESPGNLVMDNPNDIDEDACANCGKEYCDGECEDYGDEEDCECG